MSAVTDNPVIYKMLEAWCVQVIGVHLHEIPAGEMVRYVVTLAASMGGTHQLIPKEGTKPVIDALLVAFVVPAAYLLKRVRNAGVRKMPLCREALRRVGVFPIIDHYYEPLFRPEQLLRPMNPRPWK